VAAPLDPGELAWSYFALLGDGDVEGAAALLDDDGTWWTCGGRQEIPMRRHKELFPQVMSRLPLAFERRSTLVAGDTVVLELRSHAELPDGQRYDNVYAFVVETRDGRLLHVREYNDTAHLAKVAPAIKALYA